MNKIITLAIILLSIFSCKNKENTKVDVSDIDVEVLIDRFDQKFFTANEKTLQELKKQYPYLFPIENDSIWLQKITDEEGVILFNKAQKVFENFDNEKLQIIDLFKHVKYYHPNFKSPKIITLINNLDYQNKVIYADSLLLVSLDMYLGKNSEVYQDFPMYLAQNYDKSQLVVDMANAISENYYKPNNQRQFLNSIIAEGKKMYLIDSYLPDISDAQKMGYSAEKMEWVNANEEQIWKYFIENEMLYSTDLDLQTRFITDAPFSKFYIDIDKDSPGRVGVWIGWQIVRAYMKNNNVNLQQLLQTNTEEIFKNSKYKPKK